MVNRQTHSALLRLFDTFRANLRALGADVASAEIEDFGVVVHECMSQNSRSYHSVMHVFDISTAASPVQVLAALFHDSVYYTLDQGIPERARARLGDCLELAG